MEEKGVVPSPSLGLASVPHEVAHYHHHQHRQLAPPPPRHRCSSYVSPPTLCINRRLGRTAS